MTGTRYFDFYDEDRDEVLGKKDGKRRIAVRLYYPGKEKEDACFCDGLTVTKKKWFGRKADFSLYDKRIKIYENLKMKDGSFPLLLFSHGYGGYIEQNNDLCQYVADHGYIIASIGHPYEASETCYRDLSSVKFDNSLYLKMFKPFIPAVIDVYKIRKEKLNDEQALKRFDDHQRKYEKFMIQRAEQWAMDDRAALNKILQMNEAENNFLYKRIDLKNGIGVFGHSYGGDLAYYHCLFDEEISCGINIDGGLFGDYTDQINHKPFMQILNPSNVNVVSRSRLFHDAPVHYVVFKDIEHNGFCDLKLVVKKPVIVGKSDPLTVLNALNKLHVDFFDRYLKQKDAGNVKAFEVDENVISHYDIC